jgi:hypothetical protein
MLLGEVIPIARQIYKLRVDLDLQHFWAFA